ncbi:MAG: hypothetical protein Q9163_000283 [Psora crenata]
MEARVPSLMTASSTLTVILTPLCATQSHKSTRFLKLTQEQTTVDVGRASKNPLKGLQPERDNAIFDCPIMSRRHAQFTASPKAQVGTLISNRVGRVD